jgi:hypothetical protein
MRRNDLGHFRAERRKPEQTAFRRFGSTRSQVRILSPRLTFHRYANFAGAERELGGLLRALKTVVQPAVFFSPSFWGDEITSELSGSRALQ